MYLRMFHAVGKVKGKFFKRVRGLVVYIYDYKIILISLIYILGNEVVVIILKYILYGEVMGLVIFIGTIILVVFLIKILQRKQSKISKQSKRDKWGSGKENTIFVLLIISFLVMIFAGGRNLPRLLNEREVMKEGPSFTNSSTIFPGFLPLEIEEKHSRLEVAVQPLQGINVNGKILGKDSSLILLKLPTFYSFDIGQVCEIEGSLVEPENFEDFDYRGYLANRKIFFIMENPKIICKPVSYSREGDIFRNILVDLKNYLIKKVDLVLNEPQSSLLVGILFGQKRLFSNAFDDATRVSGVSHIVAASGYNVTILTIMVNNLFVFLPKKYRLIVSLIAIWAFAVLSGLSSSIIRACIMSSISMLALLFGRSNSIHILLPFTSFIFILFSPTALSNVGFLLSMSAVLGLVYILPILSNFRKKITKKYKFIDDFVLPTLSCTLATLPVSIIVFKTFSIWSVVVNALILPVLESTMLFGFLGIILQSIFPAVSYLFYSIVNVQLLYFENVVLFIRKLNFGQFTLSDSISLLIGSIVLLILIFSTIYFYPIKNEQHNHYLKNS